MNNKNHQGLQAARVFPLRPDRNFVVMCRKVRLDSDMSCCTPALWSRSALAGVSPWWRRRWWEKRSGKLRPGQLQDLCADLLSVLDQMISRFHAECLSVQLTQGTETQQIESPVITTG